MKSNKKVPTLVENIHPLLVDKLVSIEDRYIKVTKFAERIPLYDKIIISNEYTGDSYCKLADRYKTMPLVWGINWQVYKPTNYPFEELEVDGVICIYINCMSLFPDECYHMAQHELTKLFDSSNRIKVHFYDSLNSTFYFVPNELEDGLERINEWYLDVKSKVDSYMKALKIEKLQAEINKLEKT